MGLAHVADAATGPDDDGTTDTDPALSSPVVDTGDPSRPGQGADTSTDTAVNTPLTLRPTPRPTLVRARTSATSLSSRQR